MTNFKAFMLIQRLVFFYVGLALGIKHEEIISAGLSFTIIIIVAYAVLAAIFIFSEDLVKSEND